MCKKLTKEDFQNKLYSEATLNLTIKGEFKGTKKEITVIHDSCGKEIYQNCASNLLRIKSCPYCNPENHFDTEEQVKEKLSKYSILLLSEYKNEKEKVKLQYPCGCIYFKSLSQIKAGSGVTCNMCTPRIKNHVISKKEANTRLNSAPYGSFTITGEYRGVSNVTDIKCNDCGHIHHEVKPLYIEKRVQGCEVCGGNVKSVKERFIKQLLSDLNIKFIAEKSFENLRVDFYLPDFNLAIEFDGGFHDTCNLQKERDMLKDTLLNKSNIKLIRIHHLDKYSITLTILKELKIIT